MSRVSRLAKLLRSSTPARAVERSRGDALAIEGVPGEGPAERAMRTQRQSGVTEYIWRTVNDNRVCETCEPLAGRRMRWDSPPPNGHPGMRAGCRCYAEPVIDLTFGLGGRQPESSPPLPAKIAPLSRELAAPPLVTPAPDPRRTAAGCAVLAAMFIVIIAALS